MTTMVIVSYVGLLDRVLGTRSEISDGNETDQKLALFFTPGSPAFRSQMAPTSPTILARNAFAAIYNSP